jgi:hypothetical protein
MRGGVYFCHDALRDEAVNRETAKLRLLQD